MPSNRVVIVVFETKTKTSNRYVPSSSFNGSLLCNDIVTVDKRRRNRKSIQRSNKEIANVGRDAIYVSRPNQEKNNIRSIRKTQIKTLCTFSLLSCFDDFFAAKIIDYVSIVTRTSVIWITRLRDWFRQRRRRSTLRFVQSQGIYALVSKTKRRTSERTRNKNPRTK